MEERCSTVFLTTASALSPRCLPGSVIVLHHRSQLVTSALAAQGQATGPCKRTHLRECLGPQNTRLEVRGVEGSVGFENRGPARDQGRAGAGSARPGRAGPLHLLCGGSTPRTSGLRTARRNSAQVRRPLWAGDSDAEAARTGPGGRTGKGLRRRGGLGRERGLGRGRGLEQGREREELGARTRQGWEELGGSGLVRLPDRRPPWSEFAASTDSGVARVAG